MEIEKLRALYNACDPHEALDPADPRCVDVDRLGLHSEPLRGRNLVDHLARTLDLTDVPQVVFLTGIPGAGLSTELRRLAARIVGSNPNDTFGVWADAEEYLDLTQPVDIVDVVLMLLAAGEQAALLAQGRAFKGSFVTAFEPIWSLLTRTDARIAADASPLPRAGWLLIEMRGNPTLRRLVRTAASSARTEFFAAVRSTFDALLEEARALGRTRAVFVIDSLERASGISHGHDEMLSSFERLVADLPRSGLLPGHLMLTIPPALSLRRGQDTLHFLPMIRIRDRKGQPDPIGYAACRAIVERRVPRDSLSEILGEDTSQCLDVLIAASGGSPRALLRLLQSAMRERGDDSALSEGDLRRILRQEAAEHRRYVTPEDRPWLNRVAEVKRLNVTESPELMVAERMLTRGLVMRYENGETWFDVHPSLVDVVSPRRVPDANSLHRLTLTNIGPYPEFSLDLRPGWNVLLGDNGCGKTTVIRAIALALAGTDPRAAAASSRLLRADQPTGTVTAFSTHGEDSTALVRVRAEVRANTARDTLTQQGHWLVLGFPAMRGVTARAISGATPVAPPVPGAHDLLPLLEGSTDSRLDDTRQWIVNTALRADGNEGEEVRVQHRRLLDRWFSILRELMPGLAFEYERVDRESWQVLVKTADGTLPIEQLSQGMVSTIGWIGTLLRRLYEAYPDSETPEHEPALVLVDEIDAHLHPGWQQKIVPLVREHFPRVQVIATSHSPLVASNLEPGEVVVFSRDGEGRITASRVVEPLRGYRADQVLTSPAFGLDTTRSEYAQTLLRDYAEALSQDVDTPEARERLAELTARVRREIPAPPETAEERRAVDEAMDAADDAVRTRLEKSPDEAERIEAMLKARRDGGAR